MDFLSYREQLGIGLCDDKKYQHFLTILFNFLNGIPTDRSFSGISTKEYLRFCSTTGTQISNAYMNEQRGNNRYNHCIRVLAENADEPKTFFSYYIAFTNVLPIKRDGYAFLERGTFANLLVQMLKDSHIAVDLVVKNGEYFVFPKGAVELDSALVSQPLAWLNQYPKAHTAFVKALREYADATTENASDIADKFRKALETFFQEFFKNDKAPESNKSIYGNYLSKAGVPKEIASNFETLLQTYCNFMNGYAKHHDKTELNVLEYLMYQTGNIIRLLITLKQAEPAPDN